MRRTMVFAAVVLLAVVLSAFAQAETRNYPLSIATKVVKPGVTQDVVMVHWAGGVTELDKFMDDWWDPATRTRVQGVVPAALAASGTLPVPAAAATMTANVTIPISKRAFVYGAGSLPVWLRVVSTPKLQASQDSHERFKGSACWSFTSYFITKYTADVRVTKFHDKEVSVHNTFDWVDP